MITRRAIFRGLLGAMGVEIMRPLGNLITVPAMPSMTMDYDAFWTATIKAYRPALMANFLMERPSVRILMAGMAEDRFMEYV